MSGLRADEASLLLAVVMAGADGRLQRTERRVLLDHLAKSDEAPRLEQLLTQIEKIAPKYAQSRGAILAEIKAALPTPKNRHDAMVLAMRVANADGKLKHGEVDHAVSVSTALGMSQAEFSDALSEALI